MSTTFHGLWIQWLSLIQHDYRGHLSYCVATIDLILQKRLDSSDPKTQRLLEGTRRRLRELENVQYGLCSAALKDGHTLKGALFAASAMLNRTFDIDMSPECDVPTSPSMPIILMMLLGTQCGAEDPDQVFVEVSCPSDGGYRLFITPHRAERGADWDHVETHASSGWGWLEAVSSELASSGHSFTVRSKGPLSTFLIVNPPEESN